MPHAGGLDDSIHDTKTIGSDPHKEHFCQGIRISKILHQSPYDTYGSIRIGHFDAVPLQRPLALLVDVCVRSSVSMFIGPRLWETAS